MLWIKVSLSPLEIYYIFHIANILLNSSTQSQNVTNLNGTPKGRLKKVEGGHQPCNQTLKSAPLSSPPSLLWIRIFHVCLHSFARLTFDGKKSILVKLESSLILFYFKREIKK